MLTQKAYAKINLTLEVLSKRPDGYHEISSIMQTIDLSDTLTFEPSPGVSLSCAIQELETEDNLCLRAARLLQKETQYSGGVRIQLTKRIPMAAGLGGGSSDAATTLLALNGLWEINLPQEKLLALAQELGSDVAFFLFGGTALAEGRGERVTPLPAMPTLWVVLLKPPFTIPRKTARLFSALNTSNYTNGDVTKALRKAIGTKQKDLTGLLFNVFDSVAPRPFPGLEEYKCLFLQAGAPFVHLCGSGSTLFTLVEDEPSAQEIHGALVSKGTESYLCRFVTYPGGSGGGSPQ